MFNRHDLPQKMKEYINNVYNNRNEVFEGNKIDQDNQLLDVGKYYC